MRKTLAFHETAPAFWAACAGGGRLPADDSFTYVVEDLGERYVASLHAPVGTDLRPLVVAEGPLRAPEGLDAIGEAFRAAARHAGAEGYEVL